MSNLALVKSEMFEDVLCDFWKNENEDIFMTSEQLGKALKYSNPQKAISNLVVRNEYLTSSEFSGFLKMRTPSGTQETRVFTEDGIYEVTMLAKTNKAKEFRTWVRNVLKGLRKGNLKLIDNKYNLPTTYKEALIQLLATIEENEKLSDKANGYDLLCSADNSQTMNEVAKSFGVGRNKLFAFLRNKEILMSNNLPYQKYCDNDCFDVREFTIHIGNDEIINKTQTLVMSKGIDLINKLLKEVKYKI